MQMGRGHLAVKPKKAAFYATGASPNWVLVPKELSTGNPIYDYQNPPAAETRRIFIAPDSPAAKGGGARASRYGVAEWGYVQNIEKKKYPVGAHCVRQGWFYRPRHLSRRLSPG